MLLKDTVNLRTKRAKRNEWYEMKTKKTCHELAKSNTGEEKKKTLTMHGFHYYTVKKWQKGRTKYGLHT